MIESIYPAFLVAAGLVTATVLTSTLAFRFGAPLLLVFLLVGLIAGEDGLGIPFNDAASAYRVGSLALAVILFDSGFGTRLRTIRQAGAAAAVLATVGVVLTAGLVGIAARLLFGLTWLEAFLLGAIVGSTDAAAVFFLLRVGGIAIQENVRATLEIESGSNDPIAIFLTLALIELIGSGGSVPQMSLDFLLGFTLQMGLGVAGGLLGGYLIVAAANRIKLEGALYPIGVLSAAISLFGLVGSLGGSGFLAVYIAGLVAGNSRINGTLALGRFFEGTTWLAQISMFLILGLLATPSEFLNVAVPSIGLALALTVLCRPIAVWLCLLPFGYRRRETAFISWVGLRGSVSILLGIIPLTAGLANGQLLFNVAYIIVLSSLVIQGWTIRPMARWLGLIIPSRIGPVQRVDLDLPGKAEHELFIYRVVAGSPVVSGGRLPRWARPSLIVRDGHSMKQQNAGNLREGDLVYLFVPPQYLRLLDRLFASPTAVSRDDEEFYGTLLIDAKQSVALLTSEYPTASLKRVSGELSIGDFMANRLGGTPEVGDRVNCGEIDLIVRDVDPNGAISEIGLAIIESSRRIPLFFSGNEIATWLRRKLHRRRGG